MATSTLARPKLLAFATTFAAVSAACGAPPDDDFASENEEGHFAESADALVFKAANYQPDLEIEIEAAATCTPGNAYVNFWVHNLDRGYAAPSVLAFRYGPAGTSYLTRKTYVNIPAVRPYGSEYVEINIRNQPRVQLTADALDALDESNESNNTTYLDCTHFLQVPNLQMKMR